VRDGLRRRRPGRAGPTRTAISAGPVCALGATAGDKLMPY